MHCISVYLLKREEIRNEKLSEILDNKNNPLKFTELDCGILAITEIPNIKEFGKDKTIVRIETDYFGGWGEQSAVIHVDNKVIYNSEESGSINEALQKIGIIRKDNMDEFDTIGLGNYRSNKDFK